MNRTKDQTRQRYYLLQLICSALGILTSLYLLLQHTRLKSGIQEGASICSFGKLANCDVVAASHYSEIFGIPLAAIGTIFFVFLLFLGLLAPPKDKNFRKLQQIMAWFTLLAFTHDLFLLGVQIFVLGTLCTFCFATYLLTLIHLYLNGLMVEKTTKGVFTPFRAALTEKAAHPLKVSWNTGLLALLGFSATVAAVYLLPSRLWLTSDFYSFVNNAVERFYQEWKDKPEQNIKIFKDDGQYGNPKAKVKVVEFSDFECPFCQKAAFTLHSVMPSFKDKALFVFKHYPLDSSCNPDVSYQMHPHACKLAKLSYCANKKGKFWEMHNAIFFDLDRSRGTPDWDAFKEAISGILTPKEISQCLNSSRAAKNVSDNIKIAKKLNIRGTPSIYINGKQVTIPVTTDTLKKLIELESQLK